MSYPVQQRHIRITSDVPGVADYARCPIIRIILIAYI